ncbi:MAG: methylated-DNA--[protein]-cysteine S-methyltransferase [Thiotrichaceae bacterium]|nr:methylated-DNA--[protein]-cysteine S-methyltransferase [Thiotrichaceae bacterium]
MSVKHAVFHSPIGDLHLIANDNALIQCDFSEIPLDCPLMPKFPILAQALDELSAYFAGELRDFTVPVHLEGAAFTQQVWEYTQQQVKFGKTQAYGEIAAALNKPKAARAVGVAMRNNPVALIMPCHRVVASTGKLTGYAGGIWRKAWLLAHEMRVLDGV